MTIYRKNKDTYLHEMSVGATMGPQSRTTQSDVDLTSLVEGLGFNRGNAVVHIFRAGFKSKEEELIDLEKAVGYINREIRRLESE